MVYHTCGNQFHVHIPAKHTDVQGYATLKLWLSSYPIWFYCMLVLVLAPVRCQGASLGVRVRCSYLGSATSYVGAVFGK